MNDTAAALQDQARAQPATQEIVVDEFFPHAPELIWHTLTTGELISRWMMKPTGFEAVAGKRFTFQTTPAGAWDGTIDCEVLAAVPNQSLVYRWRGGDDGNVGYGSPLDTVVSWTLTKVDKGTRLRLVHSGFVTPTNDSAFKSMSGAWKTVVNRVGAMAGDQHRSSRKSATKKRAEARFFVDATTPISACPSAPHRAGSRR